MDKFVDLLKRWRYVFLIVFLVRITLLIFAFINQPHQPENILSPWFQWDGYWYEDIVKNWYHTYEPKAYSIAFYPFYPLVVKVFSFLFDIKSSFILVSLIFSLFSSIILYELTSLNFSKKISLLSVWFMNIYPTAYFFQASYTESLFLTLTLLTIYLYRKKLFLFAGITGFLSTFTRLNGLLLLPALFFDTKLTRKSFITFFLLPLGFINYLLINLDIFDDPFHFQKVQKISWYKSLDWPWNGIQNGLNYINAYKDEVYITYVFEYVFIILIALFAFYTFWKVKRSYAVYILVNLLLFTSTSFILSTPRYSLILFPIFIALAKLSQKSYVLIPLSVLSISLLFYFTSLYTQGRWAF